MVPTWPCGRERTTSPPPRRNPARPGDESTPAPPQVPEPGPPRPGPATGAHPPRPGTGTRPGRRAPAHPPRHAPESDLIRPCPPLRRELSRLTRAPEQPGPSGGRQLRPTHPGHGNGPSPPSAATQCQARPEGDNSVQPIRRTGRSPPSQQTGPPPGQRTRRPHPATDGTTIYPSTPLRSTSPLLTSPHPLARIDACHRRPRSVLDVTSTCAASRARSVRLRAGSRRPSPPAPDFDRRHTGPAPPRPPRHSPGRSAQAPPGQVQPGTPRAAPGRRVRQTHRPAGRSTVSQDTPTVHPDLREPVGSPGPPPGASRSPRAPQGTSRPPDQSRESQPARPGRAMQPGPGTGRAPASPVPGAAPDPWSPAVAKK